MEWPLIYSFAAALLAVINPLGNLPIFISYTADEKPSVQRRLALLLSVTVSVLLFIFLFIGPALLEFFGISIPAFRIAGGILLLLTGIGMIRGHEAKVVGEIADKIASDDRVEAENRFRRIVIPLGIPLIAGPGSISTVILYASQTKHLETLLGMSLTIILISSIVLMTLVSSSWIKKVTGELGMDITTRIMGLLLAAIGIQFVLSGLNEATIGLINPEAIQEHFK